MKAKRERVVYSSLKKGGDPMSIYTHGVKRIKGWPITEITLSPFPNISLPRKGERERDRKKKEKKKEKKRLSGHPATI